MTASSSTPEAKLPADAHVTEPTDEHRSEDLEQGATEPDSGDEVDSLRTDEEECEDEHLKQYMEQFFKAYNIGEFSASKQPVEMAAPVQAAQSYRQETPSKADHSRAQDDTTAANVGSSDETRPIGPGASTSPDRPKKRKEPEGPTKPPESVDDLRELRRLVNKNTRQAIKLHAFQQSVWVMRVYLTLGLVSIASSMGLLLSASDVTTSAYVMGVLTFVIAAVACLRYLRLIRVTSQAASRQHHSG